MKAKKLNRKAIVGSLAVLAGFSTIGSVVGTVAWYQYSTMVTASVNGANAGVSTNLEIAVGKNTDEKELTFQSDLKAADIKDYLDDNHLNSDKLKPITTGAQTKDAVLGTMKSHPVYQYFAYENWVNAQPDEYVEFPVTLRVNKSQNATVGNRDIFIQDLKFANAATNDKKDVTDALRIEFSCGDKHMLVSNNGQTTDTYGELDLNKDGNADYAKGTYEFDIDKTPVAYGADKSTQTTYEPADLMATDDRKGALTAKKLSDNNKTNSIGTLNADSTLTINIRIWLEGWQKLKTTDTETSAIWTDDTMESTFNIGMTFAMSTKDNA